MSVDDQRLNSVSFTESQHLNEAELPSEVNGGDDNNVPLSLAPHVQTYLAQVSQEAGCWGRYLPMPFERAAGRSWWDPTFDSEILEEQFKKSASTHNQVKFRYALWYILLMSISWFLYFLITGLNPTSRTSTHDHWPHLCFGLALFIFISVALIFLTHTAFYLTHLLSVSFLVALALCLTSLALTVLVPVQFAENITNDISPLGHFAVCTAILLLTYTVIPLRLYMSIAIALSYSVAFEGLTWWSADLNLARVPLEVVVTVRLIAHVCVHVIGVHILIMTNVRMRNTFMKVGQSLLVRRQLESEKKLKENMLHSLMPPSVAQWLLSDDEHFITRNGLEHRNSHPNTTTNSTLATGATMEVPPPDPSETMETTLFRPFNMNRMDNVSILFADIVGFTKISGSKSAEQLVEILNELFRRFDLLCAANGCEKISTLGDCYYCVSGCPEARADHAKCCVEMGLGMIQSMKQFDRERNEGVTMRVGVHTGTVLCGLVGSCRVKFDVWSNDVTLANRMESTGRPGMVHISESTARFIGEAYFLEDGEAVFGLKTFFILGRKNDRPPSYNGSIKGASLPPHSVSSERPSPQQPQNTSFLQLIVSPPTSPPSMSPQTRPRVLSCDTPQSLLKPHYNNYHYLTPNPNQLSPDVCKIKANSLPSILDSECEQQLQQQQEGDGIVVADGVNGQEVIVTPTSTASSGRYSVKIRGWKMPRFLRKSEPKELVAVGVDQSSSSNNEESSTTTTGYQQVPVIVECGAPVDLDDFPDSPLPSSNNPTSYFDEMSSTAAETTDVIDVKSYISQSRSDIGQYDPGVADFSQFMRTGSYRSQYGTAATNTSAATATRDYKDLYLNRAGSNRSRRGGGGKSPHYFYYDCGGNNIGPGGIVPSERSRSATVNVFQMDRPRPKKTSLDVPCVQRLSLVLGDDVVVGTTKPGVDCLVGSGGGPAVNSRKDSGIKSNSRRSSIQQIEPPLDNIDTNNADNENHRVSGYYTSSQSTINSLQHVLTRPPHAPGSHTSTNRPPPLLIGKCVQSLRKQSDRQLIRCVQDNTRSRRSYFMRPPLNPLTLFFSDRRLELDYRATVHAMYAHREPIATLANAQFNTYFDVFVSAMVFLLVSAALFLMYSPPSITWCVTFALCLLIQVAAIALCFRRVVYFVERTFEKIMSRWYRWNGFGGVLVSLPLISVLVNYDNSKDYLYSYLLLVGVIHYCNFTQLNCWMKNFLCTACILVFIILVLLANNSAEMKPDVWNSTSVNNTKEISEDICAGQQYSEVLMDLFLLLVLVWGLNRAFEIYYRDGFHTNYVANRDRQHVETLKNQADWLIYNIVPEHVAEKLRQEAKYSENFPDVAIIFASIVNFNEMYDESYLGGREFLRVLNELIGDFDDLLDLPEFHCVEKIKTIGSTFMAASGLNSRCRHGNGHLFALMDFARAMQRVIEDFNRDLLEFNLILRIGYNFGEVTAAVIGQTKLYYDIWGDAVNIASRMDSTGVNGRIQVGEHCLSVLEKQFTFEARGSVYVKGKDNMNVYLLSGKIGEDEDDLDKGKVG